MRFRLFSLAIFSLAIPMTGHGMSKKQIITVRFHMEANANDGEAFAAPITLQYQRRQIYLSKAADISEKQISRIFPFPTRDGSWGCAFKLDAQGRLRLETLSAEARGSTIVGFIGTEKGKHQVVDMVIDRPITDGVITIPRGITELEVLALKAQFKTVGEEPVNAKPGKPNQRGNIPETMPDGRIDRPPSQRNYKPAPAFDTSPPPRRGQSPEPALPRLAD
jgi:hypothetical protein